jgi:hypothetical protein
LAATECIKAGGAEISQCAISRERRVFQKRADERRGSSELSSILRSGLLQRKGKQP